MTTEWVFAFPNTAVVIFCLMYCLNIPHSNQNPSFFPVYIVMIKYFQHFFFVFDFTIVTADIVTYIC